ncbi:MAG: type II/IV secretion system protein [Deltaproteobacteria bacterium]|nr:type II/IV secretion system protein [Deltaproteobacteria bacterium]
MGSIRSACVSLAAASPDILRIAAWVVGSIAVVLLLLAFVVLPAIRRRTRANRPVRGDDTASRSTAAVAQPLRLIASLRQHLIKVAERPKADVVELLDFLVTQTCAIGASDIHFTPTADGIRVGMRVDGLLYDLGSFSADVRNAMLVRVKVLAKLNVYKRDAPQDGRFAGGASGRAAPLDIRVSILPTIHGEKIVLRFLGRSSIPYDLDHLGMDPETLDRYRALCARPQGMILVTGPTGSGKTTTMYASLAAARERRGAGVNIVTIENPVEYVVPYLNQTQVNEETGLTFAAGLRSVLRQDPNVIMVGEIRDKETVEIAMQAGLTGQLIFSTVHAESSAGVITRLLNMEVEPFVLASAVAAVVGQRLVRRICPACITRAEPDSEQLAQLKRLRVAPHFLDGPYWKGNGCDACLGMGVTGRTGLFELLELDDGLRDLVVKQVPTHQLHAEAQARGMRPLLVAGLEHARSGAVPLDEVLASVGT